jgi:hypothetical protein
MPFEFESRTFHNSGGEDGGGSKSTTHIHQSGRHITINGKPVFGLRRWMIFAAAALAWLGVMAVAPLLGVIWFLLACVGGVVYLLTRD